MLRGMEIHSMIGSAAGHRTHLEHLQLHAFATQDRPDFVPVHLPFRPPLVGLWHEHFAVLQSQLLRATLHVAAHRTLAPVEADNFRTQPVEDAAGRVALLRWRRKIRSQYLIDEIGNRVQLAKPTLLGLGRRRFGAAQRLPHHPPMHAQLPRHTCDRSYAELILRRICSKTSTLSLLVSQLCFRCPIHEA